MSYIDQPFPACVALGAVSTSDWAVAIVTNQGGYENRNLYATRAKHRFDCALAVKSESDFRQVRAHWHTMRGRTHSFPFKDPVDHRVEQAEGVLVALAAPGQFQLYKRYGDYLRKITRPYSVQVYSESVPVASTASGGVVALTASGTRSISSHTVGTQHRVTLTSALPSIEVGDMVALSGVTGTAAGVLNGKNLEVTAIAGADVTVAVTTTGLTASGGALSAYPGTLQWSGQFYTPCRYDMAGLPATAVTRKGYGGELLIQVDQLPLIEVYE